MTELERQRR